MAKQLNIDLNVRANTAQAKQQFQELQKSLSDVAFNADKMSNLKVNSTDLKKASSAAQELQRHLSNAVNTDTGKLNLNALNASLQKSKSNIGELSGRLLSAGTSGQEAFMKLATSIAAADRPLVTLSGRLNGFLTTLKNTARWQISSTILHGFMGALQGAYGYAQDLNESLNNIRIVTGQNIEQMAKFAEEANKAAKNLSSTTTDYTNASLIYYQQGLSDSDVKKRTDTTIKLANVSRQSAEEVSSQMTSIWNNFAKGNENLEKYADVITALGASTASSSDEIAQGLSKFAAVADTVGLSYDKAAASVATVVAETRQSADIVGTAFKTIFARLEGLSLGKTLDDGVTLNKYSQALKTVGVDILDANKNIKQMDTILDELSVKWNNISDAQKVALAETVAGTRQYTQLVSLMDNYDKVQANQIIAESSEGTIQKQADIYAESWEAAQKRVQASLESLYSDLLDDKFFIDMNNGFSILLNSLHEFIKGAGGLQSVLFGIGGFVLSGISNKIQPAIDNLRVSLTTMFQTPKQQAENYQKTIDTLISKAQEEIGINPNSFSTEQKIQIDYIENLSQAKNKLTAINDKLTDSERQLYQQELNLMSAQEEEIETLVQKINKEKEEIDLMIDSMGNKEAEKNVKNARQFELDANIGEMQEAKALKNAYANDVKNGGGEEAQNGYEQANQMYIEASQKVQEYKEHTESLISAEENIINTLREKYEVMAQMNNELSEETEVTVNLGQHIEDTINSIDKLGNSIDKSGFTGTATQIEEITGKLEDLKALRIDDFSEEVETKIIEVENALKNAKNEPEKVKTALQGLIRELNKTSTDGKKLSITFQNNAEDLKKFQAIMKKFGLSDNVKKIDKSYKKMGKTQKELEQNQQRLNNAFNKFNPKHIITGAEAFTKVASAGLKAATVINSVRSAITAITDKDMDPIQKFTTLLMSVGTIVPSILGIAKTFSELKTALIASGTAIEAFNNATVAQDKALKVLKEDQEATSLISELFTAIQAENSAEIDKNTESLAENLAAKELCSDKEEGQIVAQALANAMKEKGSALTEEETAAIIGNVAAQNTENVSLLTSIGIKAKAILMNLGLASAELSVAAATGILLAALIAVVAIIAAVVIGINALNKMYNADAEAAKDTAEGASKLAEAYKNCKEEYTQLQETISKYNSALKALETLTIGTKEWRDAVRETNEEARKLIEQYKLLEGIDYTIDENGIIRINTAAEKKVEAQKEQELNVAEANSLIGSQKAKEAQATANVTKLKQKNDVQWYERAGGAALAGLTMGAGAFPAAGYLMDRERESANEDKKIDESIARLTTGDLSEDFKKNLLSFDDLKDKLKIEDEELIKSIRDLATSINENTDSQKSNYKLAAQSLLQNNTSAQGKNKDNISQASGFILKTMIDPLIEKYSKEIKDNNSDETKRLVNEYFSSKKLDQKSGFKSERQNDGSYKYEYYENGQKVENSVNASQIATEMAQFEKSEDFNKAVDKFDDIITNLKAQGNSQANIDFISSRDFSKTSKKAFNQVPQGNNINKEYLDSVYGDGDGFFSDLEATTLGFSSASDMIEEMKKRAEETKTEWENINNTFDFSSILINFDDLSLEAAKSVTSQFKNISLSGAGEEAGKDYLQGLNNMIKESGIKESDQVKALEQLGKIDWTQTDALEQAQKILKSFNGTLDTSAESWKNFGDKMKAAAGAVPDFSSMKQDLLSIIKILSNLKFGSTIDQTSFDTLTSKYEDWKQFFQAQADGTYKFIGNVEKLKEANREAIVSMQEQTNARQKMQSDFNSVNFEYEEENGKTKKTSWNNLAINTENDQNNKNKEAYNALDNLLTNADNKKVSTVLSDIGWTKDQLKSRLETAKTDTGEEGKKAKEALQKLIERIAKFQAEDLKVESQNNQEIYASTAETFDQLQKYKDQSNDGTGFKLSEEAIKKQAEVIKTSMLESAKTLNELDAAIQESEAFGSKNGMKVSSEEQSKALLGLAEQYKNTGKEVEEYNKVLLNLQTDSSTETGLTEASQQNLADVTDKLRASILAGEAASKYSLNADTIEAQAKAIKKVNSDLGMTAEQATKVAIANERMNTGVKTLHDNFKDWKKTLQTAEKTSKDYAEAAANTTDAIRNLLSVSDDWELPDEFLDSAEHLNWLTQASKGSEEAINKIGLACAKSSTQALTFNKAIAEAYNETAGKDLLDSNDFVAAQNAVIDGIDTIQNHLNDLLSGKKNLSDVIDTDSFVSSLNQLALTTGMTVDEMNDTLSSIGVQAKVETVSVPKRISVPTYKEYRTWREEENPGKITYTDVTGEKTIDKPPSGYYETYTVPGPTYEVDGYEQIAQISTAENPLEPEITSSEAPKVSYTGVGGTSNRGSTNRGGGVSSSSTKSSSSSSNKTSAASQSNTVHRYSQESAAVNDLTKEYSRLNKAKDSAFGASKIQAMEQELAKLKQLKQASQNYLDSVVGSGNGKNIATAVYNGQSLGKMIRNGQVGGYAGADYSSLYGGINASGTNMTYVVTDSNGNSYNTSGNFSLSALNARFGTNLQYQFDSNGNIANKDSLLNSLQALKNSEENRYSSISNPTGEQKTYHSQSLAYLSEMESRLNQYTSTLSTLQEQVDSYLDNIANMQAKNAEIISTKLSNGINLSSNTISKLNRAVIVLGDKIYKNAEDMKKFFSSGEQSLNEYEVQGKVNEQALNEAIEKYNLYVNGKNGKLNENAITPAEAAAIAKEIADNYDTLISDTKAKITELQEQYSNTLDYWTNKMNDVNSSVEKTISSLTHLQNVLNLIGQSTSYEKIDKILRGKLTATTDDYKSKKRQSDEAEKVYNKAAKNYEDILAKPENKNMSDEAKDALYNSIVKKAKDDYQTKLAETEKALEDMSEISNSVFENSLNAAYAKYENAITGKYGSFNELENSMKRQSSIAEQYLTKTNQLYETNIMLRKLSQDIDKTDSQIAKQKLKAFSDEIQSMQTQEKLSKTDLDIAKARYEVLKAQITLEEAQNAKSTVRLHRDSEGNYGYVYTADQDKISDAEQNLADKQNALYNLALSNTQNYTEKMIQLEKEYVEAEKQLYKDRADGLITNDGELKRLLGELQKQYQELGLAYSESYIDSNTLLNEVGAQGETEAWTNAYNNILDNLSLFNNNSENASQEHNSKILKITNNLDNSLKDAWAELEESRRYYQAEAEAGNAQLKESVKSLTNSVKDQTNEVTKKGGLADSYKKATSESGKYMNKLVELYKKQEDLIESFKNAADKANNFYNKVSTLKEETNNLAAAQERYNTALSQTTYYTGGNSDSGSGGSRSGGGSGGGSATFTWESNDTDHREKYSNGTYGQWKKHTFSARKCIVCGHTQPTSSYGEAIGPMRRYTYVKSSGTGRMILIKDEVTGNDFWIDKGNRSKFGLKSGGYTGSWNGPDIEENGKLAFLHQKELVLNAQDTENMLNAVKLIRQISQTIDLQAMSQSSDVLMRSTPFAGERQTLQQDVVIHAEFPNATNHSEIEEAFENLVNRASQYANRSF